jgi:hypothetical protein
MVPSTNNDFFLFLIYLQRQIDVNCNVLLEIHRPLEIERGN